MFFYTKYRRGQHFGNPALIAILGLILCCANLGVAQTVQPDGTTSTGVTVDLSGHITVDLAPANAADTSHNTYTNFSVLSPGVSLNNATAGAATIVNEVTSSNPSVIQGPLTVIGPEAHVIIANPNGITVDGGQFVNTGNVALTTGAIDEDGAGRTTSTVTQGVISVGANGLSGAMSELDLIAKSIQLNGAISYDTVGANSHVNIIAGDSVVDFDAARVGGILPWGLVTDRGAATTNSVIVNISENGNINAGRISVTVTDQGAGVRIAGDQLAAVGGFRLNSAGLLEIDGADITSSGSVNIMANAVDLVSAPDSQVKIQSLNSGVTIETTSGDIDLGHAAISGDSVSSDNLASAGGVTLISQGDITTSQNLDQQATLSSANSNVVMFADADVNIDGLSATTAANYQVSAGGRVLFGDVTSDIGQDFVVLSNAEVEFDTTIVTAQRSIRLDATTLRFGGEDPTQTRTELIATTAGFTAKTSSGDISNFGSLLQGSFASAGDVESLGGVSLYSAGDLVNRSLSVDRLAVIFGQTDDLHIETDGSVINQTGRLFSNAGITVAAADEIWNETLFTESASPFDISTKNGARFASSLWLLRSRVTSASADYGTLLIDGEQSIILGVGDVALSGSNISNIGGEITGANVEITTTSAFYNEARSVGTLDYKLTCRWFCSTSGSSDLQQVGGIVNAANTLSISADTTVRNLGGQFNGRNGIEITAPLTEFLPTMLVTFVERPVGLFGFFRGRRSWVHVANTYGALNAFSGEISIDGDASLGEALVNAIADPTITGTIIESSESEGFTIFGRGPIGLFWNIF